MNLGPWEILIIAVVIVLLFGARKMPQMARSLGQSMRILKAETKGMRGDEEGSATSTAAPAEQSPRQELSAAQPVAEQSPQELQKQINDLQGKLDQQSVPKNSG